MIIYANFQFTPASFTTMILYYCRHQQESFAMLKLYTLFNFEYNQCGNCTRYAEEMHTFNAVIERHTITIRMPNKWCSWRVCVCARVFFVFIIEILLCNLLYVWVEIWNGIFVRCVLHFNQIISININNYRMLLKCMNLFCNHLIHFDLKDLINLSFHW